MEVEVEDSWTAAVAVVVTADDGNGMAWDVNIYRILRSIGGGVVAPVA